MRGDDGKLCLCVPVFTHEQKRAFDAIVERIFSPLMPEYTEVVEAFVKGYKALFPRHLHEDVCRLSRGVFVNLYRILVDCGQQNGLLEAPSQTNRCDVLIQWG